MNLPESTGWLEFTSRQLGQHFGSLIEDAIQERDNEIERLDRECELLRARLDELVPKVPINEGRTTR